MWNVLIKPKVAYNNINLHNVHSSKLKGTWSRLKLAGSGPQERYQILRQNSDPDLIKKFPYPKIKIVEKGPNIMQMKSSMPAD